MIYIIILVVLLTIMIPMGVITLLWEFSECPPIIHFCHNALGWHKPDKNMEEKFDGCSWHSLCKYCGKDIMKDSQGNWFTSPLK